jgi:hypothetical protein
VSIPICRKGRLEHVWRASCHRREEKLAPYRKSRLSSQVQQREGHPPATACVVFAHELGLVPITTSAYSPQSNGLAEAFVGRFKRDYISGADAESVLVQLGGLVRGLQHSRTPRGARDAEPGRVPGGSYSKLLTVSRTLGSIPFS